MKFLPSTHENTAILHILSQSGQQALHAARATFDVYEKGREDFVTSVDQALDQYLSQAFAQQFPADGIITEENQASATQFLSGHQRLWLIDPIDGTEDFINRGQNYSIMVGLLAQSRPQAGWVYAPAQGRMYWGGPQWGLFQQAPQGAAVTLLPRPLALGESTTMLLGDRDQRRFGAAIAQSVPDLQFDAMGSFGLKVLEVIKGQAGLYVYLNGRVKLWDTTGPLALAEAAGLICCDLDGQAIQFDANSIFPNTLVHRQPLIVGWPNYVEKYLSGVRQAVLRVRCEELSLH